MSACTCTLIFSRLDTVITLMKVKLVIDGLKVEAKLEDLVSAQRRVQSFLCELENTGETPRPNRASA